MSNLSSGRPRAPRDWAAAYSSLIVRQAELVAAASPIVAGFSATTDAIHVIDEVRLKAILDAAPAEYEPVSRSFAVALSQLQDWIRSGRDGEILVEDESAERLLEGLIGAAQRIQCGGTSIQAAWSWSEIGASSLLSLTTRSRRQLEATAPGILLADPDGALQRVGDAEPSDDASVPSNHVIELPVGTRAGAVSIPRSSRIMMIFARKRLQLDPGFATASPLLVAGGVGLASGFNGLGEHLDSDATAALTTVRAWRAHGAGLIHLELADYGSRAELDRVLKLSADVVDSIGMNESEFGRLVSDSGDIAEAAAAFGRAHDFSRVVIHGDRWAMSVHTRHPATEESALLAGCLAAANRAEAGAPRAEWRLPARAEYSDDIPRERTLSDGRTVTVVATPYLHDPASTIGLGDTFVSGDLLVQAATTPRTASHPQRRENP